MPTSLSRPFWSRAVRRCQTSEVLVRDNPSARLYRATLSADDFTRFASLLGITSQAVCFAQTNGTKILSQLFMGFA
jgi:hypothetical protein